jgi:hypothetical protein
MLIHHRQLFQVNRVGDIWLQRIHLIIRPIWEPTDQLLSSEPSQDCNPYTKAGQIPAIYGFPVAERGS